MADVSVLAGQEMAALSEGNGVGLAGVDELFALLALLFLEIGHGREQEAEFAGGGDGPAVFVGVGLGAGEDVDLVGESVGGDGAEDVGSVGLEVAEVGVDGGAGAAELSRDLFRVRVPWQSRWWASRMRRQRLGVGGLGMVVSGLSV